MFVKRSKVIGPYYIYHHGCTSIQLLGLTKRQLHARACVCVCGGGVGVCPPGASSLDVGNHCDGLLCSPHSFSIE